MATAQAIGIFIIAGVQVIRLIVTLKDRSLVVLGSAFSATDLKGK